MDGHPSYDGQHLIMHIILRYFFNTTKNLIPSLYISTDLRCQSHINLKLKALFNLGPQIRPALAVQSIMGQITCSRNISPLGWLVVLVIRRPEIRHWSLNWSRRISEPQNGGSWSKPRAMVHGVCLPRGQTGKDRTEISPSPGFNPVWNGSDWAQFRSRNTQDLADLKLKYLEAKTLGTDFLSERMLRK